jgi:hypothetical protein
MEGMPRAGRLNHAPAHSFAPCTVRGALPLSFRFHTHQPD